jgi:hypothetical protein
MVLNRSRVVPNPIDFPKEINIARCLETFVFNALMIPSWLSEQEERRPLFITPKALLTMPPSLVGSPHGRRTLQLEIPRPRSSPSRESLLRIKRSDRRLSSAD